MCTKFNIHRSNGNKYNKFCLSHQGEFFDTEEPSNLVIPILPLATVLNWASNTQTATEYDVLAVASGEGANNVSRQLLAFSPKTCSTTEIEIARVLLEALVKGVAGSIKEKMFLGNLLRRS